MLQSDRIFVEANMRIGIVTAMAEETLPVYQKLGNITDEGTVKGVLVRKIELDGNTLYLAQSGVGEIRAAMTAQLLVDLFEVEAVLNFGFVGAIAHDLSVGELVLPHKIVHYQFDISAVDNIPVGQYNGRDDFYFYTDGELVERFQAALDRPLRVVTVASGDKFVATKEDKQYLSSTFGAEICEMESAALALVCERNGIPFFSLKVVSDNADETATTTFAEVLQKGLSKYEHLLPLVMKTVSGGQDAPLPPVKRN